LLRIRKRKNTSSSQGRSHSTQKASTASSGATTPKLYGEEAIEVESFSKSESSSEDEESSQASSDSKTESSEVESTEEESQDSSMSDEEESSEEGSSYSTNS